MSVRRMTLDDLHSVLGWAAEEGWNPGQDDAAAFHGADPQGFFVKEIAGQPVAAISVVNHSTDFAFLGLYLCRPEYRGQGFGMEIWRAGLAHAGARCVGLDGVPEQQANYVRSGFTKSGRTIRFQGSLPKNSVERVQPAKPSDITALIKADALATGITRPAFSQHWFSNTDTRQTSLVFAVPRIAACATTRACVDGVKVGPLHAETAEQVLDLLCTAPRESADSAITVDVPESCSALVEVLEGQGFVPVFETARMYSKAPPTEAAPPLYAIATMELG